MIFILVLFIDVVIAAMIVEWLLTATGLAFNPRFAAAMTRISSPYLVWVRNVIAPQWNGHDLARPVGIFILVLARSLLALISL